MKIKSVSLFVIGAIEKLIFWTLVLAVMLMIGLAVYMIVIAVKIFGLNQEQTPTLIAS